jgi:TatD DNase family protein
MMLVDTHCHLNFKAFSDDVEEVILRARGVGVRKIIVPGAAMDTSYRAIELGEKFEEVYATVGIHPHHVDGAGKEAEKELWKLSEKRGVMGIGETGLDYKKKLSVAGKDRQKEVFRFHLELAKERGLPVVIHNRQAGEDVL